MTDVSPVQEGGREGIFPGPVPSTGVPTQANFRPPAYSLPGPPDSPLSTKPRPWPVFPPTPRPDPSPRPPWPARAPAGSQARLRGWPGRQRAGSLTGPQLVLDSEELLAAVPAVPAGARAATATATAAAALPLHLHPLSDRAGRTEGNLMGQQTPRLVAAPGAELRQRHNSVAEASLFPALAAQLLRLLPSAGTASTPQPRALHLHLLRQAAPPTTSRGDSPKPPALLGAVRARLPAPVPIGRPTLTFHESPRPAARIVVAWRGGRRGRSADAPIGKTQDSAPPTGFGAHAQVGLSSPDLPRMVTPLIPQLLSVSKQSLVVRRRFGPLIGYYRKRRGKMIGPLGPPITVDKGGFRREALVTHVFARARLRIQGNDLQMCDRMKDAMSSYDVTRCN